jgi:hypothetical protein
VRAKQILIALSIVNALALVACDMIFDEDEDEQLMASFQYYTGDELTQHLDLLPGEGASATINCDRMVEFGLINYTEMSKVELVREVDGEETVCELLLPEGGIKYGTADWPARSTTYTLKAHTLDGVVEFGPFEVTVEEVGEVVIVNGEHMGDQGYDGSGYGCFFQSRHVGWGGGDTTAGWPSFMAEGNPRLLDWAVVTEGGTLQVISPDLIQQMTHDFERLAMDCGFLTTTFEAYSGDLDPELAQLSLAEVEALPDPPAGATSIALSDDLRFVYLTEAGKKGLVKIVNLQTEASGSSFDVYASIAK